MKKLLFFIYLLGLSCLFSCSDSSTEPIVLVANAGPGQQVNPLDLVSLDGTKSQGPEGFTYLWTYSGDVPESEIKIQSCECPDCVIRAPERAGNGISHGGPKMVLIV